ncbi:MAG: hypothetical protein KDA49_18185 [Rhodospirillaceae bacterium]|nr:hypothetical protein [Rhodospirillaceae bacterium]MCA8934415.1 hypothetical protein [Rhodospirillaceae bacterium]
MLDEQVKAIFRSVLEERFDDVEIVSVDIEPGFDHDGDPILNVRVIFDGKRKVVDGHKVASFWRHLRSRLDQEGRTDVPFPVISYIAKSEWKNAGATAH